MLDHLSGQSTVDASGSSRRRLQMNLKFKCVRKSHNYFTAFPFSMKVASLGVLLLAISSTFTGSALAQSGVQVAGAAAASSSPAGDDASPKSDPSGAKSGLPSSARAGEAGASADEKAKDAAQNPLAN